VVDLAALRESPKGPVLAGPGGLALPTAQAETETLGVGVSAVKVRIRRTWRMRRLSRVTAAACTACAFAVAAAPAVAHEFVASKSGKVKGSQVGQVEFALKPFIITCNFSKGTSKVTAGSSETFFVSTRFKNCVTKASIQREGITLKTKFKTPVAIEYHANGFIEVGSEGEEFEGSATLKGGEVEIYIPTVKCEIYWPEQTVPVKAIKHPEREYEEALYETQSVPRSSKKFPSGFQNKLVIHDQVRHLEYEYEEGQCSNFAKAEEEQKKGEINGEFVEELAGGNLEFH
jgi:hypothetical protein